jgi:hypothetical protein
MAGRKHELELEIHRKTGEIRVIKDSGFDVALVTPSTGTVTILNPRPQVILERDEQGRILARQVPDPERTKIKFTPVDDVTETKEADDA